MKVVIGIGGSGSNCACMVQNTLLQLKDLPRIKILGTSPIYKNPASGGITVATFANAAVLIQTPQSLGVLWQILHHIERRQGRIRLLANGPRTVDLDILWADQNANHPWLKVPHPRFLERDFALLPALAAFRDYGQPCPSHWTLAARRISGASRLRPINA